jgi:hypothetical protein
MCGIMDSLLTQALKASRDPKDCRRTYDMLRRIGFSEEAFKQLHRRRGSPVTFFKFSEDVQLYRDDGNNHRVHQRLLYVLSSCPNGAPPKGKSFQGLAEEAYRQIPPVDLRVLTK